MTDKANSSAVRQGGETTRERLIEAGLKVFGESGYNGTSTREIANEAGANLAAIPYHFGGKKGLYLAVAEHIVARISELLKPVLADLGTWNPDTTSRKDARELLHLILRRLAQMIIFNPHTERWAAIILREQAHPTDAFDVFYGGYMHKMITEIGRLVSHLTGTKKGPDATLLAMTIIGQVLIFRTARAAVLRQLDWADFDQSHAEPIISLIQSNADACLGLRTGEDA